jgi:hypothetical protein
MYWKKAIQVFAGVTAIALLYVFTIGNIKTAKARKSAKLYPKESACKSSFEVYSLERHQLFKTTEEITDGDASYS